MQSAVVFASLIACAYGGLVYSAAPAATASQFHAQDELGQYSYGYAGGPSTKAESKDASGVVRGSYSYIDANGLTQTVNYVADPVNGFRVAATNLPVGPAAAPAVLAAGPAIVAGPGPVAVRAALPVAHAHPVHVAHVQALPLPPADTPEVAAAKAQHAAAHAQALARSG